MSFAGKYNISQVTKYTFQVEAYKYDGTYAAAVATPFTKTSLEVNSTLKVGSK